MTTLNLSYTLGLVIKSQVGTNPSNYSSVTTDIFEQVQSAILLNSQEYTHPFTLAGNDSVVINLASLRFSFIKLVLIKNTFTNKTGNPKIRYSYIRESSVTTTEGSLVFIANELPTVLPATVPDIHSITIQNLSAYPVEGTMYLTGLKLA